MWENRSDPAYAEKMVVYSTPTASRAESWTFNMCNFSCQPNPKRSSIQSGLINLKQSLGYGEYSIWMKTSRAIGAIASFSLSKKDANGNLIRGGIRWDMTADDTDAESYLQGTSKIQFPSQSCQESVQGASNSQLPNRFYCPYNLQPFKNTTQTTYNGALQYIIGLYPDRIVWRIRDWNAIIIYERVLDIAAGTDTVTVHPDIDTPFRIENAACEESFDSLKNFYRPDEVYPTFEYWHLPYPQKLWINQTIFTENSFSGGDICINCDKKTQRFPGSRILYYGPFMFQPVT